MPPLTTIPEDEPDVPRTAPAGPLGVAAASGDRDPAVADAVEDAEDEAPSAGEGTGEDAVAAEGFPEPADAVIATRASEVPVMASEPSPDLPTIFPGGTSSLSDAGIGRSLIERTFMDSPTGEGGFEFGSVTLGASGTGGGVAGRTKAALKVAGTGSALRSTRSGGAGGGGGRSGSGAVLRPGATNVFGGSFGI
jgi:hypothetical protein